MVIAFRIFFVVIKLAIAVTFLADGDTVAALAFALTAPVTAMLIR